MGKIIKENGIIWLEEIQTPDGNHRRLTKLGTYNEKKEIKEENTTKEEKTEGDEDDELKNKKRKKSN